VHTKDLFIDNGSAGKTVEAVGKGLPELDTETSFALVIKSIDPIDGSALVISTQNEKVFGVLDLVRQEQANGFQTLLSAVHIVSQKDVIGLGREPTILKETQEIVILSVNVTANLDWGF
jgi:hypothetical protein